MCVLCHEDGYDDMLAEWRETTDALQERVQQALTEARAAGLDPAAIDEAARVLEVVVGDGSRGVHNHPAAESLLGEALRLLGRD
jgi:hypothetical protein